MFRSQTLAELRWSLDRVFRMGNEYNFWGPNFPVNCSSYTAVLVNLVINKTTTCYKISIQKILAYFRKMLEIKHD